MTRISEGFTNNYLIHGVFLLVAAAIIFAVGAGAVVIIAWFLVVLAIVLFAGTNGLEIDFEAQRYRRYGKFGPLMIGVWSKFSNVHSLRIQIHTETAVRRPVGFLPFPSASSKSLTYDVLALDSRGNQKKIYGFLKYRNAKKAAKVLRDELEIELRDIVAEKLAENRAKRARR